MDKNIKINENIISAFDEGMDRNQLYMLLRKLGKKGEFCSVEEFVCSYPHIFSSLTKEHKTYKLKCALLDINSTFIKYIFDHKVTDIADHQMVRDIIECVKYKKGVISSLDFLTDEVLLKIMKETKEVFRLKNGKISLPVDGNVGRLLFADKELFVDYLNSHAQYESVEVKKNNVVGFQMFFFTCKTEIKNFFSDNENWEYFLHNTKGFISRDLFLLVLDGNEEKKEQYFLEVLSNKDPFFDYSSYIRKIKMDRKIIEVEREMPEKEKMKRKI